jgi:hypothetical protein
LQVFTLLNLLLETMGPELRPQVGLLLAALPHIWQGAAGQSLLRIQVRRTARVNFRSAGDMLYSGTALCAVHCSFWMAVATLLQETV